MNIFENLPRANGSFKDQSSLNVNPTELKSLSTKLSEAIQELIQADKEERMAWENAKSSLGPKMALSLKETFEKTDNEYYNSLFLLNKYADSLSRVSTIWDSAEDRIMKAINAAAKTRE